ncbi:hypothetical protein ACS0TY_030942 [Phlomoides rotata]
MKLTLSSMSASIRLNTYASCNLWRVKTVSGIDGSEIEYICQWLVFASDENADRNMPEIKGDFDENFRGKKVLVVGCGNSGMEVSLDLCNHDAKPSMVRPMNLLI